MSLRQFHLCFIFFVAICSFAYAAFVLRGGFGDEATRAILATGWGGGVFGALLIVYGVVFAIKSRRFAD